MSQKKRMLEVTIIYNKSNSFGLANDAKLLSRTLSGIARVRISDPLEPPVSSDVNIHLELPIYSFVPWANTNILVVNPEHYVSKAYNPYLKQFNCVITKEDLKIEGVHTIPWTIESFDKIKVKPMKEFLYLLGGSKHKRSFAKRIISNWKPSYPKLTIYSVEPLQDIEAKENVELIVKDLSIDEIHKLQQSYEGHICCSDSEGFGYSAAEAEYVGAFMILNTLSVYQQDYKDSKQVCWIQSTMEKNNPVCPYGSYVVDTPNIEKDLDNAMEQFNSYKNNLLPNTELRNKVSQQAFSQSENTEFKQDYFRKTFLQLFDSVVSKNPKPKLPPVLQPEDCPPISIVTLLYNRRRFFDLACHNIMISDYPIDKIEWIIVEDSDDINEDASDKVVSTAEQSKPLSMIYVPLRKKTPISEKRNIGVEKASNEIVLFMDDDDHYPITSFRRRVAWLTLHPMKPKATVCTTIACYDLKNGISAVNCPPLDLPLGQRISEATLTFYKSWFQQKPFDSSIQVGEGESLIEGREADVLEIPPQQIIVAFSHGNNTSSRRIPATDGVTPSCFWGFPKEYLVFIHKLAGVNVNLA